MSSFSLARLPSFTRRIVALSTVSTSNSSTPGLTTCSSSSGEGWEEGGGVDEVGVVDLSGGSVEEVGMDANEELLEEMRGTELRGRRGGGKGRGMGAGRRRGGGHEGGLDAG